MGRMPRRVVAVSKKVLAGLAAWPLLVAAAPMPTDERSLESTWSAVAGVDMPVELAWPDLGPADPVTNPGTLTVDVEMSGHRFAAASDGEAGEAGESDGQAGIAPRSTTRPAAQGAEASVKQSEPPSWLDWAGLALAALVVVAMAVAVLRPSSSPQAG